MIPIVIPPSPVGSSPRWTRKVRISEILMNGALEPRAPVKDHVLQGFLCYLVWAGNVCQLRSVNCKVPAVTEKFIFHWFYKGWPEIVFVLINCKVCSIVPLKRAVELLAFARVPWFRAT